MKNISKKFEIELFTEETSNLKTGIKCYVGDDIEYTVKIMCDTENNEEAVPMDLTGCTVEAKALRMTSKTTVVQEFGIAEGGEISIVNPIEGTIKFKMKDTMVESADKTLIQFTIVDSDECISIQPFLMVLMDTIESENIVIPSDDIRTLKNLGILIEDTKVSLEEIKSKMETVEEEIGTSIEEMKASITLETDKLSKRLEDLESQADNIEQNILNIGNSTIRQVALTPFVNGGENTVSFKMEVRGSKAKNLIGASFMMNLSYLNLEGKQGTCYNGHIGASCYKDSTSNSFTYLSLVPVYTPSVPGVQINPYLGFNGSTNKIDSETAYYEIWIKTAIPKECINSANCYLTSFGNRLD